MMAFDTDVLSDVLFGITRYVERLAQLPADIACVPVVAVEEVLRGWLHSIRQADSGKGRTVLTVAYEAFRDALVGLNEYRLLPYTPAAHDIFLQLKSQKIRIGTRDLRIASIALAHDATLVTRNRRDFDIVPTLKLEVWN